MVGFTEPVQRPGTVSSTPSLIDGQMTPDDAEGVFNENEIDPFRDPRAPTQVEFADASGSVPMPERGPAAVQNSDTEAVPLPERGERAPSFNPGPLVPSNDSRYSDTGNIVIADTVLGGMLPWIQAAADIALGRVPIERFDDARREHEERVERLKGENQALVSAAENAMPLLSGLGLGMIKPAKTALGTVGRGVAVGGAQGAVQGATSGDPAEPTLSSDRLGSAIGGAAKGAALGGLGASLPAGAAKVGEARDAAAATAKRQAATDKAAATKRSAADAKNKVELQKRRAEEERSRDDQLVSMFKSYRQPPAEPYPQWKGNRADLAADPVTTFRKQALREPSLEDFSRMTNLPPAAIMQRLYGKGIKPETPAEIRLWDQLKDVDMAWQAAKRRGVNVPDAPGNPSAQTKPSGSESRSAAATAERATGAAAGSAGTGSDAPAASSVPKPKRTRKPADPNKLRVQPRTPVRAKRTRAKSGT